MAKCDVLIVGGGPAGSTCAWRLRQAGLDVMIADASTFPRDKVCAGWITPQAVTALRLNTQDYASERTFQPFTGFRVGLIGGDATRVAYDRPVSFGIRRCEFDHYLLQRAGARLMLGAPIASMRRDHGEWIVNDAIRAPLLVGAGGSGCPVARMMNGNGRGRPLVVAREAEAHVSATDLEAITIEPDVPELFFCRDLQGYGWCVRKGEHLNVGLGRLDPRSLPAATERFVAFLEATRRIPPHFPWRWRGHSYAVHAAPRGRMIDDGVMLIGDAAGVAGQFSRDRLQPYAAGAAARFADAPLSGVAARLVPDAVKAIMAGQLLRIPAFVKRVVIDEWFLHRHQLALAR
jgi:flavin-dependent dehydrogenase